MRSARRIYSQARNESAGTWSMSMAGSIWSKLFSSTSPNNVSSAHHRTPLLRSPLPTQRHRVTVALSFSTGPRRTVAAMRENGQTDVEMQLEAFVAGQIRVPESNQRRQRQLTRENPLQPTLRPVVRLHLLLLKVIKSAHRDTASAPL